MFPHFTPILLVRHGCKCSVQGILVNASIERPGIVDAQRATPSNNKETLRFGRPEENILA